jgi:DNA-directed RNA polymerase specialized sigma24 family protein
MVEAMTKGSRADRAAALERWADDVQTDALVEIDTTVLRHLGELAEQRATIESELREAVLAARRSDRSWSEIGAMLGVSKQAAQRKYGRAVSAA